MFFLLVAGLNAETNFQIDSKLFNDKNTIEAGAATLDRKVSNFAKDNNINTVYEIGAGKVLSGLVKRIDGTLNSISINDPSQIDNFELN